MIRNPVFAASFVTVYLLIYTVLFHTGASYPILVTMFAISPFLVIWMVYVVIRFGKYSGPELQPDEEWGYQDKKREDLGIF